MANLMLTAAALAMAVCSASAAADRADTNAAAVYQQAFAAAPQDDGLLQQKWMPDLDARFREAAKRSQEAVALLRRAATIQVCQWQAPQDEALADHPERVMQAWRLARTAVLCGTVCFRDGRNDEGFEVALGVCVLGRRVGAGGMGGDFAAGDAIEQAGIDLAAANFIGQKPETLRTFETRFQALPPPATAKEVTLRLRARAETLAKRAEKGGMNEAQDIANALFNGLVSPEQLQDVTGGTDEGLVKFLRTTAAVYGEVADLKATSRREFDAALATLGEKIKVLPEAGRKHLPSLRGGALRTEAGRTIARALLAAAFAVARDGPNAVKNVQDPFGTGPFDICPHGDGFDLMSNVTLVDRALIVFVGQAPNPAGRVTTAATRPAA